VLAALVREMMGQEAYASVQGKVAFADGTAQAVEDEAVSVVLAAAEKDEKSAPSPATDVVFKRLSLSITPDLLAELLITGNGTVPTSFSLFNPNVTTALFAANLTFSYNSSSIGSFCSDLTANPILLPSASTTATRHLPVAVSGVTADMIQALAQIELQLPVWFDVSGEMVLINAAGSKKRQRVQQQHVEVMVDNPGPGVKME